MLRNQSQGMKLKGESSDAGMNLGADEQTVASKETDVQDRFTALYHAATTLALPLAIWSEPGRNALNAIVAADHVLKRAPIDFTARESGFVFAPFVDGDSRGAYALPAHVRMTESGVYVSPALRGEEARRADQLLAAYDALIAGAPAPRLRWYTPFLERRPSHVADEAEFTDLVRRAVDFIHTSGVAKVVVSRTLEQPLPEGFHPAAMFMALRERYPHAFVSLVGIPGVGMWLGATPEVLLRMDDHSLSTMALAGTQRLNSPAQIGALRWGRKEIVEQEMVSAYIREFFQRAGEPGVKEIGPMTISAGQLAHLQTVFRVEAAEDERLALANRILHELHPTSAVCGMPKQKALAFIQANEGYDRSFYSGFLGPLHIDGRSSLYVNLRCMRLNPATAQLYVGAGVTAESSPAAEWAETELKAETILAVLHHFPQHP